MAELESAFQTLRTLMSAAESVEELLQLGVQRSMTFTETLIWLVAVAQRATEAGVPAATVTRHPGYRGIQEQLERIAGNVRSPGQMLAAVRTLLQLGVPPDEPVMAGFINEVIWMLRKMPMKHLLQAFTLGRQARSDKLLSQLYTVSLETIQRRWVEIGSADDVIYLLKNSGKFSSEFVQRVEDRAIDSAPAMSSSQVSRLLSQLAQLGRRPVPLLRALSFQAARQADPISFKDCVRTLFAIQKLGFPDRVLLEKLGRDLVTQTPHVENAHTLSLAVTAAGLLRWRHLEFLEAVAAWYDKNLDSLGTQEIVALIVTLATVNYRPTNTDSLIPRLLARCPQSAVASPHIWLDLVWSLAVLGQAAPQLLQSALQPSFTEQLQLPGPAAGSQQQSPLGRGAQLKLLNLAELARLRDGYQGGQSLVPANTAPPRSQAAAALQKQVLEVLVNFLPPPKYLRVGVPPAAGIAVDGEFCVSDAAAPLAFVAHGSALPGTEAPASAPPPGVHRIALCTWTYHAFTIETHELTGFNQMAVDLLELSGYKVLEVSHSEVAAEGSVVGKVKYLRQKIRDLVSR